MRPIPLEYYATPYQAECRGKTYNVVPSASDYPAGLINSFKLEWELREKWWTITSGDVVIDVGAGYGSYTLSALALGADRVIALEPGRGEYFDLCTNLLLNGFWNRCTALNVLAGEMNCVIPCYSPETHSVVQGEKRESRVCYKLDSLIASLGSSLWADWIKIDVEGSEMDVLQGAKSIIEWARPKLLIENHLAIYPNIREKINEFLAPFDYSFESAGGEEGTNESWTLYTPN